MWKLFGFTGYVRVDFRVTPEGEPLVLEINTNPCIAPDAGFAAAGAELGIPYDQLIVKLVDIALSERAFVTVLRLSKDYVCVQGAPVIHSVDTAIFSLRYFMRCMACTFCNDQCCSYGVDIDLGNVMRLAALGEDFSSRIAVPRTEWFTEEPVADAEFPTGRHVRTRTRNGKCVFRAKGARGCTIHAYALEKGIDYHELKPMVSTLFPATFEHGVLVASSEVADGSLICQWRNRSRRSLNRWRARRTAYYLFRRRRSWRSSTFPSSARGRYNASTRLASSRPMRCSRQAMNTPAPVTTAAPDQHQQRRHLAEDQEPERHRPDHRRVVERRQQRRLGVAVAERHRDLAEAAEHAGRRQPGRRCSSVSGTRHQIMVSAPTTAQNDMK